MDENTNKMLARLKRIRTIEDEECSGFVLTNEKDYVRCSLDDLNQAARNREVAQEDILNLEQMAMFLSNKLKEEIEQGKTKSKISKASQDLLDILNEMVKKISKLIEKLEKTFREEAQAKSPRSFRELFEKINDPGFEECLDSVIAGILDDRNQKADEDLGKKAMKFEVELKQAFKEYRDSVKGMGLLGYENESFVSQKVSFSKLF